MKTLLSGAVIVTCDEHHTVHANGDLVFEDDRIIYVGPSYDGEYDVRQVVTGGLLMPGLINAHTHSGMSILRTLADDVDLMVFLEERVWPRETNLTAEDVYVGSRLSAIEMLKGGITSFTDMYFYEDALLRAALDTGIRTLITPTIIDVPVWAPVLGSWEQQLERALNFCRRHDGEAGRIHTGLGPHAPYTLSLDALDRIATEARALDVPINIHLVETAGERDSFNSRGIGSTAHALDDIGFFEGKVIAAHSVWTDQGDLEIYRDHRVGVAHCPQSNAKLGAGIAPLADMLAHAVNVGLGTDGPATNNNLDLWEEMRMAPMLAKVSALDPKVVPATQALAMATRVGALAIHQPQLGVLAPQYKADVLLLSLDDTTVVPIFEPATYFSHLVYSVTRDLVRSVWVNGRQVVRDHEVIGVDEQQARREAQAAALSLSARAGF